MKKGQKIDSAYQSDDPDKRKNQLRNLKQNWSAKQKAEQEKAEPEKHLTAAAFEDQNIIEFCEMFLRVKLYPA